MERFENALHSGIYLFIPQTDDGGTAIGAALYAWHHKFENRRKPCQLKSLGRLAFSTRRHYTESAIQAQLDAVPVYYYKPHSVTELAAQRLFEGQVGGWFQGASELGPRALGNRSILANPQLAWMRDHINLRVKQRESFRPLAPVTTEEQASRYFDMTEKSPFMLFVFSVREEYRSIFPAITHIDGSARVQTVTTLENKLLYQLLRDFEIRGGHPVLLNTSFNLPGEPIVESPADATDAFMRMALDFLIIGPFFVEKHTPWAVREGRDP